MVATSICRENDTVYAIVKNTGTFQPEIVEARVIRIGTDSIRFRAHENALCATEYDIPRTEWRKSVFPNRVEAEEILYGDAGANWRKEHGLDRPPKYPASATRK